MISCVDVKILRNSGICPKCKQEIVSNFTHDYRECECGHSMVDGGNSYLRRTVDLIDTSITEPRVVKKKPLTKKQVVGLRDKIRGCMTPNRERCGMLMKPKCKKYKDGQTNYYICTSCDFDRGK